MARLEGRAAIVTGAAQGIGATYAKAMAREGAHVVVADVLDATNTVNIIRQAGGTAIGTRTDVTDGKAVAEMVARADLSGAVLRGADLSESDLRGADLTGADLRGCNLQNARIEPGALLVARIGKTVMPDGSVAQG